MFLSRCFVAIVLLHGGVCLETKYKRLLLKLHNDARAGEGSSNMNKLVWDDLLEKEATDWANTCVYEHQRKGRGENLAYSTWPRPEANLTGDAFQSWFDEKNLYSYGQHSCGAACHYTQVVWHSTRRVGCAMKWCNYLEGGFGNERAWYIVCFYDPPGNIGGEKPYARGRSCSACQKDQRCVSKLCSGGKDHCEDTDENCDYFIKNNVCFTNTQAMKFQCKYSCGLCTGPGKPAQITPNPRKPGGGKKPGSSTETCKDKSRSCANWSKNNGCNRNKGYMHRNCKKSCGLCQGGNGGNQPGSGNTSECKDQHTKCAYWAKRRECNKNPSYMNRKCKKSCNQCGGSNNNGGGGSKGGGGRKEETVCEDKNTYCQIWAENGECKRNPGYMHSHCMKACKLCSVERECKNAHNNCQMWADHGECDRNPGWMHFNCRQSCRLCAGRPSTCKDNRRNCAHWARIGECTNNPSYMKRNCKKSCNIC